MTIDCIWACLVKILFFRCSLMVTNIFGQHDIWFHMLKGMRAQSSICSHPPCMMTLWHALRHSSNLITMWNSCFNSSFSLVWQLQNNFIASLSLFVTIANLLVIGKYQLFYIYALVGRRWRYFERTGGQNVCIDPHPSKAKRTNFAGVGEVYTLLRTRHLSFHRSFCDYQKISIPSHTNKLWQVLSSSITLSICPYIQSQHYMMNLVIHTVWSCTPCVWKWTCYKKIWFNEVGPDHVPDTNALVLTRFIAWLRWHFNACVTHAMSCMWC